MLELLEMMQTDQITITGKNGTKATLARVGALFVLTVTSDRRITDDEMRRAFPIPADTPPATLLDDGPYKRSRASWPVGV